MFFKILVCMIFALHLSECQELTYPSMKNQYSINLSIYEEPRFYFIPCSVLDCYLSMFCDNSTF